MTTSKPQGKRPRPQDEVARKAKPQRGQETEDSNDDDNEAGQPGSATLSFE